MGLGENTDVPGLTSALSHPENHTRSHAKRRKDLPILDLLGTIKLVGSEEQAYRPFKFLENPIIRKYLNRFAEMIQKKLQ